MAKIYAKVNDSSHYRIFSNDTEIGYIDLMPLDGLFKAWSQYADKYVTSDTFSGALGYILSRATSHIVLCDISFEAEELNVLVDDITEQDAFSREMTD